MADNTGKKCTVHYIGTYNDGTQFDSSRERGKAIAFVCGSGQMIAGFDAAVKEMEIGEVRDIHLMPEQAYGMPNPKNIVTLSLADNPGAAEFELGQLIYPKANGRVVPCIVVGKTEDTITLDSNHVMAGKELNFNIELISVEDVKGEN